MTEGVPKAVFWFVLLLVFLFIVFAVVYLMYTGGIDFLSETSLKDIKWIK